MPFLSVDDGCELWFESHGEGPAIAFVSGFMGITEIWRAQIQALSPQFRCIAHDNRGAGRSDKPVPRGAYGVERHAQDLHAILEHLRVGRVVIVGHSMGGNIALTYALQHPQRVAGVVLVGSYAAGAQIIAAGNRPDDIRAAVSTKASRVAFYQAVGLPESIALESAKWERYAVLGNAESFLAFDIGDRLPQVRCPALILHGDRDIVSPLDPCALSLRDGLPDARLEVAADTNHCPSVEAPVFTNEHIRAFLDRCRF